MPNAMIRFHAWQAVGFLYLLGGTLRAQDMMLVKTHSQRVSGIAGTPDGKRILSTSLDGTVCVTDVQAGSYKKVSSFDAGVYSIAVARGKGYFAIGRTLKRDDKPPIGLVTVYEVDSLKSVKTLEGDKLSNPVNAICFSPDSKALLSAFQRWPDDELKTPFKPVRLVISDVAGLAKNRIIDLPDGLVIATSFSSDGNKIAVGLSSVTGDGSTVFLIDRQSGGILGKVNVQWPIVSSVSFIEGDNSLLVVGGEDPNYPRKTRPKIASVIRVRTADFSISDVASFDSPATASAVSPDGRYVVIASEFENEPKVRVWDAVKGRAVTSSQPLPGDVSRMAFLTPDIICCGLANGTVAIMKDLIHSNK